MKRVLTRTGWAAALAIVCAAAAAPLPAMAEDGNDSFLGLDLNGSPGEGRHSRYVPPLTNPVVNETPYITTEVRAIYLYNRLPEDFVTDGGYVNLAAQIGRAHVWTTGTNAPHVCSLLLEQTTQITDHHRSSHSHTQRI